MSNREARLGLLSLFSSVLLLVAVTASAGWQEGVAAFNDEDWEAAEAEFTAVVDEMPDFGGGYFMLGRVQLELDKTDQALAALANAVRLEAGNVSYVLARGQALAVADRHGEAFELLTGLDPDGIDQGRRSFWAVLAATSALRSGQTMAAVDLLEARVAEDGESSVLMRWLGEVLERSGDSRRAYLAFARAFELDDANVVAGRAAISAGMAVAAGDDVQDRRERVYRSSAGIARRLVEVDVSYQSCLLAGRALFAVGDYAEAEEWLGRAIQSRPDDPWALYHSGRCMRCLERADEALARLRAALQLRPEPALGQRIHGQMARVLETRLELAEAARHYRLGGDSERALLLDELEGDLAESRAQAAEHRRRLAELRTIEADLERLGEADGVREVQSRIAELERHIEALTENLREVREALQARVPSC